MIKIFQRCFYPSSIQNINVQNQWNRKNLSCRQVEHASSIALALALEILYVVCVDDALAFMVSLISSYICKIISNQRTNEGESSMNIFESRFFLYKVFFFFKTKNMYKRQKEIELISHSHSLDSSCMSLCHHHLYIIFLGIMIIFIIAFKLRFVFIVWRRRLS